MRLGRGNVAVSVILSRNAAGISACGEAGRYEIGEATVLHCSSNGVGRSSVR